MGPEALILILLAACLFMIIEAFVQIPYTKFGPLYSLMVAARIALRISFRYFVISVLL